MPMPAALAQGILPCTHPRRPVSAEIIDATAQALKGESTCTQDPAVIVNFPAIMRRVARPQCDFLP